MEVHLRIGGCVANLTFERLVAKFHVFVYGFYIHLSIYNHFALFCTELILFDEKQLLVCYL